jgi:hypothetical protein
MVWADAVPYDDADGFLLCLFVVTAIIGMQFQ